MNKRRCCFAGHGNAPMSLCESVMSCARRLAEEEGVREFLMGNYGGFDRCAAAAVRRLKREERLDIEMYLVVPYMTKDLREGSGWYEKMFDGVLMAEIPESTPMKYRIIKANEYMADSSDFMICYVKYSWGGAARAVDYARRKGNIKIINIAEE